MNDEKGLDLNDIKLQPSHLQVVMVYGSLHTGGIDTLIIRAANYLATNGYWISLCTMAGSDIDETLNSSINIFTYLNVDQLIQNSDKIFKFTGQNKIIILSFDSSSAARAELLQLSLNNSIRAVHITGIFHPQWYFMHGQPLDRVILNKMLALSIGKKNLYFMNEECRISHSAKWKSDLDESSIIPLPINIKNRKWVCSNNKLIRIISVGRLVDFKAYNLGAPKIIYECIKNGIDISWDIYGFGPLDFEILKIIEDLNVSDYVHLKGKLEYNKFDDTVLKYDLFVGHGTSALESAILGIPSICAIIGQERSTYGYISDLPFGNVGEIIKNRNSIDIFELIKAYANMTENAKMQLSVREASAAKKYSLSGFINSLIAMSNFSNVSSKHLSRYVIAKIFYELVDGMIGKIFLGNGFKQKIKNIFNL